MNFVWYRNVSPAEIEALMTDARGIYRPLSLPPGTVQPGFAKLFREDAADQLPDVFAEVVRAVDEPFIQRIVDVEMPRMVFGRVCMIGDAAFAARPHAAAGTAKAADDAFALAEAVREADGYVFAAVGAWEPRRLEVGRALARRTQEMGYRSQVANIWQPGDPTLASGLYGPAN